MLFSAVCHIFLLKTWYNLNKKQLWYVQVKEIPTIESIPSSSYSELLEDNAMYLRLRHRQSRIQQPRESTQRQTKQRTKEPLSKLPNACREAALRTRSASRNLKLTLFQPAANATGMASISPVRSGLDLNSRVKYLDLGF